MNKIAEALVIATSMHDGQYRKGNGLPFVVHPIRVGCSLREFYPTNESLEIAGYLHDTVEDTAYTIDDVRASFGDYVATLVADVTKIPGQKWPWPDRRGSIRLKTADTLDNTRDVLEGMRSGQHVWDMFSKGRGKLKVWRSLHEHAVMNIFGEPITLELGRVLDDIEDLMEDQA